MAATQLVPSRLPNQEYDAAEMQELKDWLRASSLDRYLNALVAHEIYSLKDLSLVNPEDLSLLGITTVGARKKFIYRVARLRQHFESTYAGQSFYKGYTPSGHNSHSQSFQQSHTAPQDVKLAAVQHVPPPFQPYPQSQTPAQPLPPLQKTTSPVKHGSKPTLAPLPARASTPLGKSLDPLPKSATPVPLPVAADDDTLRHSTSGKKKLQPLERVPDPVTMVTMSHGTQTDSPSWADTIGLKRLPLKAQVESESPTKSSALDVPVEANRATNPSPRTVNIAYQYFEQENSILEECVECAAKLVHFEKEDSVGRTKDVENLLKPKTGHKLEIDIVRFTTSMNNRISCYNRGTTPPIESTPYMKVMPSLNDEVYTIGITNRRGRAAQRTNWHRVLQDQDSLLQEQEEQNQEYQKFLEFHMNEIREQVKGYQSVGEFRDEIERRLKHRLGRMIGMVDKDEATPRDRDTVVYQDRPDAVQARYREDVLAQLDKEVDEIVAAADENSDGLLTYGELTDALKRKPILAQRLKVLAFNLQLYPEYRQKMSTKKEDAAAQKVLDTIATYVDVNGDGHVSAQELLDLPIELRHSIMKVGILTMPDTEELQLLCSPEHRGGLTPGHKPAGQGSEAGGTFMTQG
uniref:SAM domain-containing protein n=1 Tax=Eutreptiella gymnastica TaxID=73025 RepID=A0A7S1N8W3_9EUGL|mmetsp:Transcript_140457/g.244537  ORF Transcript_140457/g.244537 Transcript_140457/m.244537 type:complete len:633 (+) Transcript_140457:133-2031(+)